jgi:glycerol-3-phosphate dehydrogenase
MLFAVPWRGGLLAGTMHLPRPPGTTTAEPTEEEVAHFLALLNAAIPALGAGPRHVSRVFAGLLPVDATGGVTLQSRETLAPDSPPGGPAGLVRVSGVKYTTAGDVARQVLRLVRPDIPASDRGAAITLDPGTPLLTDFRRLRSAEPEEAAMLLRRIADEESALSLEDLVYRRANWATSTLQPTELIALVEGCVDRPHRLAGIA